MKELSIFVDESGDFGHYNTKYAPQYVFSLVLHEQQNSIEEQIKQFEREMFNMGYLNHVVHTSPLIRKEDLTEISMILLMPTTPIQSVARPITQMKIRKAFNTLRI